MTDHSTTPTAACSIKSIGTRSHTPAIALGMVLFASLLQSCAKEPMAPDTPQAVAPVIGERFIPEPKEIRSMIEVAKQRKMEIRTGAKSGDGEKPLQEAIWLAEALMNSEKGDATRYGEQWITGTVNYSFPVFVKSDGSVWLYEMDLYEAYDEAMDQLVVDAGTGKVYDMDHELLSYVDGVVTMTIRWSDKDPNAGIAGPYVPSYTGCHDVDDAATMLTNQLRWAYHSVAPEVGSYYVTIDDNYSEVSPNESTIPNNYGITCYYGTPVSQGGAGLLFNGSDFTNSVCFPEAWERLQLARTIHFEQTPQAPGRVVTREYVDEWGLNVGGIPIGCYPVGFWNHSYFYKTGYLIHLVTP